MASNSKLLNYQRVVLFSAMLGGTVEQSETINKWVIQVIMVPTYICVCIYIYMV